MFNVISSFQVSVINKENPEHMLNTANVLDFFMKNSNDVSVSITMT